MKTAVKNNIESIKEWFDELTTADQVEAHNIYAREQSSDDEIHSNDDDFFNTYFENRTLEAVRAVCYGEYKYTDEYVVFNGYGNLESFNNPEDHISVGEIAADILENPENYEHMIELEETEEETE